MTKRIFLAVTTVAALIGALLFAPESATASGTRYAPLNRPGPELTVPAAKLRKSLRCSGPLAHAAKEPVLLSPATGVTPKQNYAWNYERAFTAQHRAWCTVTMPYHTLGNIETAGQYLVHAIRVMHARADRRIAVMGHSQGGMSMRWALRFWPDTRTMVNDVIGMAGSNHGTTAWNACVAGKTKCPPADWQQFAKAKFIAALNSRAETFRGVSYTEIFTHTDEVVQPNNTDADSSSALHTGKGWISNISTQDVCPTDIYEHLGVGTVDPVTYALVMDALTHRGPAKASRVNTSVCQQVYQPGVDPTSAQTYLDTLAAIPGLLSVATPDVNTVGAPEVSREPKLRCYVFAAGC
jgi:pimeloyl-ACP methyl ester carboxylesterase